MKNNIHVTYRKDEGRWAVKSEDSSRAYRLLKEKGEAVAVGREVAKNNESELVIHRRDGVITDKDSYGNDPCPPKDRKF